MADLKRPELLRSNDLSEHLRWQKHTTDNIGRINAPTPFLALGRAQGSLATPNGATVFVPFDFIEFSQGNAPVWSLADATALYVAEDGVYSINYSFTWDTFTGIRASGIVVNDYYGPDRTTGLLGLVGAIEQSNGGYLSVVGSALVKLSALDKLQLRVSQTSGADRVVMGFPYVELQIARI